MKLPEATTGHIGTGAPKPGMMPTGIIASRIAPTAKTVSVRRVGALSTSG